MDGSKVYLSNGSSGVEILSIKWNEQKLCFYVRYRDGRKRFIPLCKSKRYTLASQYGKKSEMIKVLETRGRLIN